MVLYIIVCMSWQPYVHHVCISFSIMCLCVCAQRFTSSHASFLVDNNIIRYLEPLILDTEPISSANPYMIKNVKETFVVFFYTKYYVSIVVHIVLLLFLYTGNVKLTVVFGVLSDCWSRLDTFEQIGWVYDSICFLYILIVKSLH